jgi:hypothetical protein
MPTTLFLSSGAKLAVDEDIEAVSGALNGGQATVRLTQKEKPVQVNVAHVMYAQAAGDGPRIRSLG